MNKMTLTFLLLRKNVKQLRQYLNDAPDKKTRSTRRKYLLEIKAELSKLSYSRYNLIKTIANNIDQFSIKNVVQDYRYDRDLERSWIDFVIQGTDIVLKSVGQKRYYINRIDNIDDDNPMPKVLYDKINNIYFLLYSDCTIVDGVKLFDKKEHVWFSEVFEALEQAKNAEQHIIEQQRLLEEKMREERKKEGILSKYS